MSKYENESCEALGDMLYLRSHFVLKVGEDCWHLKKHGWGFVPEARVVGIGASSETEARRKALQILDLCKEEEP